MIPRINMPVACYGIMILSEKTRKEKILTETYLELEKSLARYREKVIESNKRDEKINLIREKKKLRRARRKAKGKRR